MRPTRMRAAPENARVSESENARELRALIDRVLRAVERGELDATSSRGKALLRRLEGARAALARLLLAIRAGRSHVVKLLAVDERWAIAGRSLPPLPRRLPSEVRKRGGPPPLRCGEDGYDSRKPSILPRQYAISASRSAN